jgi:hypothetical protein
MIQLRWISLVAFSFPKTGAHFSGSCRDQLNTPYFLNQACIWFQASSAASLR